MQIRSRKKQSLIYLLCFLVAVYVTGPLVYAGNVVRVKGNPVINSAIEDISEASLSSTSRNLKELLTLSTPNGQALTRKLKGKAARKAKAPKDKVKRREHWVSNLDNILDKSVLERKQREERELGSLSAKWLEIGLKREDMKSVVLDFESHLPTEKPSGKDLKKMYLKCKGETCPQFSSCNETGFQNIEACHFPESRDLDQPIPKPPQNCPFLGIRKEKGFSIGVLNPNCSHSKDYVRHERFLPQVFLLHDVFVNSRGQLFNSTHNFDRNGCGSEADVRLPFFLFLKKNSTI